MNKTLQKMIETAIPVNYAQFHSAVNNSDKTPENYFSSTSAVPSRNVAMWYTPHTLICKHKDKYFGVPTATCIFVNFDNTTEQFIDLPKKPLK